MKIYFTRHLIIPLVFLLYTGITASTISGNISYTGTSSGTIFVAAFTNLTPDSQPVSAAELDTPGEYTLTELPDGTYYLISIMSSNIDNILLTDPWGVYGTMAELTPVTITGGAGVSGIDITLADGTLENPNPFYREYMEPAQVVQLPAATEEGSNHALYSDGSFIYLYKHGSGDGSAKIFKLNSSGEVLDTYNLTLESLPNRICWIDNLTFHNGDLWASGGYGSSEDPGWIEGIFIIDVGSSNASNQIPAGSDSLEEGLASDGVNLYVGVKKSDVPGIKKFNPGEDSELPADLFSTLNYSVESLCYGNGHLWAGTDSVRKIDLLSGNIVSSYGVHPSAAELYFNEMFWLYDEYNNTLEGYTLGSVDVENGNNNGFPSAFALSQNYPNPFNPVTKINYSIPSNGYVSLKVYNLLGKEIATLFDGMQQPGNHTIAFDASNLPSGIYLYRLQAEKFSETKKFILLK